MSDLTYHSKLLAYIIENPQMTESPSDLRLNRSSALEERKDEENQEDNQNSPFEPLDLLSEAPPTTEQESAGKL
jgi:hypothetical protein